MRGLMMFRSAIIIAMSTQNLNPNGAVNLERDHSSQDPFDTKLITRLANEFYSEFKRVNEGPREFPGNAPNKKSNGLSRGYPDHVRSYAPNVHPDSHDHSIDEVLVSGEHSPGAQDSFVFGEPKEEGITNIPRIGGSDANDNTSGDFSSFYFLGDPRNRIDNGKPGAAETKSVFNVDSIRRDFPALHQEVYGKPLIWLDNAATTHKPQSVIDTTSKFYAKDNSNIHRAAHALAARATDLYEGARQKVQKFIGAADSREIVFVRGTTEAINLVAQSYGLSNIGAGDEIILTTLEHHANIVPWQLLTQKTGAVIRVVPVNDKGELLIEQFSSLLSSRTKIVALTHVANALGTINPVGPIIALAHAYGVPVLVDGAQSTPHIPINVQALNADFFTFSGHKIFGPTGIGVLYGKAALLDSMPPWQGGGSMIKDVTFTKTTFEGIPQKFEAGTPDIAGVVGLGATIDYLTKVGIPAICAYEHELLNYATSQLQKIPGLHLIGTAEAKTSVLSFIIDGLATEDIGRYLDQHGIAVRSGHHCAQPSLRRFGLESTVRPSLAFYNTHQEIDFLTQVLRSLVQKS